MWYDLEARFAAPPRQSVERINLLIDKLLRTRWTTARRLLSLIGLLVSVGKQVPFGQCFLRPIQWCIVLKWTIASDPLDRQVSLDDRAIEALRWWRGSSNMNRGMPLCDYIPETSFSWMHPILRGRLIWTRRTWGRIATALLI